MDIGHASQICRKLPVFSLESFQNPRDMVGTRGHYYVFGLGSKSACIPCACKHPNRTVKKAYGEVFLCNLLSLYLGNIYICDKLI